MERIPPIAFITRINDTAAIPFVLTALAIHGVQDTAAKPWPKHYDAPAATWEEGLSPAGYTYKTNFYLITSAVEIANGRIAEMATTAEGVREALELFPLRLLPDETAGTARGGELHRVRIYPTHKDYRAAGGPEGSIGYFSWRTRDVMVSMERLIEPKGPRSNLEPRQRYRLLVHELVHQAMGERINEIPVWLSEGIAEYFSACQFAPGRYRFDSDARAIVEHLRAQWLGPSRRIMTVPRVSTLIGLSRTSWAADNRKVPHNAYAKYAGSLLLAHYQLELARRGGGALAEFLEAEPEIEPVPGFRRRFRQVNPSQEPLWEGRKPEAVGKALAAFWSRRGLQLRFSNAVTREPPPFP